MESERLLKKHLSTLGRRKSYLSSKTRNSYDNAELMALNWLLFYLTEDTAQALDNIDKYETIKKIRG